MKEKSFARGANREQMASCQELGLSLEQFITIGLNEMQKIAPQLGL
jgi:predicted hydrolase (HD superfamily)